MSEYMKKTICSLLKTACVLCSKTWEELERCEPFYEGVLNERIESICDLIKAAERLLYAYNNIPLDGKPRTIGDEDHG